MPYLTAYLATLVTFVAIDLVWLGVVAKEFYRREMGDLMAQSFNLAAAGAFYLLYPAAVVLFAVQPAAASAWSTAMFMGALLGLFAYGTYDLTNLATLRGWSLTLSVVDMVWGALLTGVAATAGYWGLRAW